MKLDISYCVTRQMVYFLMQMALFATILRTPKEQQSVHLTGSACQIGTWVALQSIL